MRRVLGAVGPLARLVLGVVWLVAGVLKLSDPAGTVRAVRAYDLLPEALVPAVGHTLPVLEVAVGLLLLAGLATRAAAVASAVLLLAFTAGIASAWARGLQIECGCFGGGGGPAAGASSAYPWEVARDLGLLALSAWLAVRPRTPWSLDDRLLELDDVPAWKADSVRRSNRTATAVVVAATLVVVGLGSVVQDSRDPAVAAADGGTAAVPAGAVDRYAVPAGDLARQGDPAVVVDVYEDFMCPYCGQLERLTESLRDRYADRGVQFRYHVIAFLDRASTDRYSTRAANALAVVLDTAGPRVAERFHDLLYGEQPEEGSAGLSDAQLVDAAVRAGADRALVTQGIDDLSYRGWVTAATDAASKAGVTGTPTVLVDGTRLDGGDIPSLADHLTQTLQEKTA